MANKVTPVPQLPNVSKTNAVDYLQYLVKAATRIFIEHAARLNLAIPSDGTEAPTAPLPLWQVATADLPSAAAWEGAILYDSTANRVKFSDGATWTAM